MKDVVYISIVNDLDKLDMTQSDLDEMPNVPFVLQGQGLPDDEEDDDDDGKGFVEKGFGLGARGARGVRSFRT